MATAGEEGGGEDWGVGHVDVGGEDEVGAGDGADRGGSCGDSAGAGVYSTGVGEVTVAGVDTTGGEVAVGVDVRRPEGGGVVARGTDDGVVGESIGRARADALAARGRGVQRWSSSSTRGCPGLSSAVAPGVEACRKGNVVSSNTTWREVKTRRVVGS